MVWTTMIAIVVVVIALLLVVGFIDGNRFVVVEEEFHLPKLKKECRFVMISDLHNKEYGDHNDTVIAAVEKAKPDFIVIAGDLVTSHVKESTDPGVRLVNALSKKYKIYYAPGNHETKIKTCKDSFGDKYEKMVKGMQHPNLRILADEHCILPEYGINVIGLELDRKYFARFKKRTLPSGYIQQKLGTASEKECNVLIAHNPEYFEEYAQWGADLVLSGHVHGGIMRLPLLGGVISPSYNLFPKYDGGIFYQGDSVMLLGRGMGAHTIPLRFFNPAELHVVTLKPKQ